MNTYLHHQPLPDVVYHYCSVETFFHIISNHTLRLSDIEKSNDFMEKKWTIQQCLQHIRNNINNPDYPCSKQPKLAASLLQEMERQFHHYNTMILAACFSSKRDLLSQWRGYGENGYGVCIGVSSGTEFLPAFRRAERYLGLKGSEQALPDGLVFHSVQYTTKEIEAICMQLFCIYMRWLPLRTSLEKAAAQLIRILYPALPFFKSHAFSEEAEWRCVYYPELPAPPYETQTFDEAHFQQLLNRQNREQSLDRFLLFPLDYRLRQNNLVPYRDLAFDSCKGSFIRSVTIGPKCPLDRETVKVFLERYRIPIDLKDIHLSDVSYR
ncbi:MAG: DUF2971 domain-containing protein [Eubacteriales bacterium]|nr:DUF2971 domain-containing protein [Eubacteriales bacterium]